MDLLPAVADDGPAGCPQFFALVNAHDPDRVYYLGVDVGNRAFTVRCDPQTHHTNFGHWNSMESALRRLDKFSGGQANMALLVYDSVPVMALTAMGEVFELTAVIDGDVVEDAEVVDAEDAGQADDQDNA